MVLTQNRYYILSNFVSATVAVIQKHGYRSHTVFLYSNGMCLIVSNPLQVASAQKSHTETLWLQCMGSQKRFLIQLSNFTLSYFSSLNRQAEVSQFLGSHWLPFPVPCHVCGRFDFCTSWPKVSSLIHICGYTPSIWVIILLIPAIALGSPLCFCNIKIFTFYFWV